MFFTISNIISFFRLLLTIPMSYFLMNQMNTEALLLGILAVLTDLADGYIARKMNQISEYGKIIDPIADKVFVGVSALCLVARGSLPIWFVVAIIARDIIILLGGLYAKSKIHFVIPSNYIGKATVIVIASVMCAALFGFTSIVQIGSYFALAMMLISLFSYGRGMFKQINEKKIK